MLNLKKYYYYFIDSLLRASTDNRGGLLYIIVGSIMMAMALINAFAIAATERVSSFAPTRPSAAFTLFRRTNAGIVAVQEVIAGPQRSSRRNAAEATCIPAAAAVGTTKSGTRILCGSIFVYGLRRRTIIIYVCGLRKGTIIIYVYGLRKRTGDPSGGGREAASAGERVIRRSTILHQDRATAPPAISISIPAPATIAIIRFERGPVVVIIIDGVMVMPRGTAAVPSCLILGGF